MASGRWNKWKFWSILLINVSFSLLVSPGRLLTMNGSALTGPWVLSPWLGATHQSCGLDITVFLHPRQSGRYTVWLIERDKPPLAILTTEHPHVIGWVCQRQHSHIQRTCYSTLEPCDIESDIHNTTLPRPFALSAVVAPVNYWIFCIILLLQPLQGNIITRQHLFLCNFLKIMQLESLILHSNFVL